MVIREKQVVLRDGSIVLLRSAVETDAEEICHHKMVTSGETYYMARYPEECVSDLEKTRLRLKNVETDEQEFMVTAFSKERIVGDAGITRIRTHKKYLHRAGFGISIQKEFWGLGLGRIMVRIALEQAKRNGFEQVELGVFSDNPRAIHLYETCGFQKTGMILNAFKLKDGTYRDEIQMVCFLEKQPTEGTVTLFSGR